MNSVILVGRLVKDPELRRTSNDIPVVQFTLAVNRPFSSNGEKTADFINCVVWRAQAENLAKYMHKGSQIGLKGTLQVRTYDDNNGAKKYITEVVCDNIYFLESKGSREQNGYYDIDSYDIPEYSGSNGVKANTEGLSFENTQGSKPVENNKKPSDDTEDPFAKLQTSSGVSDDDLPF